MRAVQLVLAVMFTIFAGLQYNDPDPVGWALVYLAAALLAVGSYRGTPVRHLVRPLGFSLAAVCLVWMITLGPGMTAFVARGDPTLLAATMKAGDPVIEEAREFLGLGIVLLYSLAAVFLKPAR